MCSFEFCFRNLRVDHIAIFKRVFFVKVRHVFKLGFVFLNEQAKGSKSLHHDHPHNVFWENKVYIGKIYIYLHCALPKLATSLSLSDPLFIMTDKVNRLPKWGICANRLASWNHNIVVVGLVVPDTLIIMLLLFLILSL